MFTLAQPTQLLPATVSREWRCVLEAAPGLDENVVRHVQVLVPSNAVVRAALFPDPRVFTPRGQPLVEDDSVVRPSDLAQVFGYDRTYKGAIIPSGAYVPMHLTRDQKLYLAADFGGTAECALLIEFRKLGGTP